MVYQMLTSLFPVHLIHLMSLNIYLKRIFIE
jgi:hypothetical protein